MNAEKLTHGIYFTLKEEGLMLFLETKTYNSAVYQT